MADSPSWNGLAPIILVVVLMGLAVYLAQGPPDDSIEAGQALPALTVEGWLNTDGDSPSLSEDKILVVDCWASWCVPCRHEMPHLAKLAAEYKPLGVEVIGLTMETERDLPRIEKFMSSVPGFTWPVGYGAVSVLDELDVQAFPTLIVFDRSRRVAWSGIGTRRLAQALDELLAR